MRRNAPALRRAVGHHSGPRVPGSAARYPRGQALVEFAIVVPLLLLLVIGIVEFAAVWRAFQVVTNSAREGARMAVVADGSGYEDVRRAIDERLRGGGLDPGSATVVIECDAGTDGDCFGGGTGPSTEVRISYPYTFLFLRPVANWVGDDDDFPGSITMATGMVMRNE